MTAKQQPAQVAGEAPLPVKSDRNGKIVKNYTRREWFEKIMEEVLEAHGAKSNTKTAEELTDIITVCVSYLEALGFNAQARAEIQAKINNKNRLRGYFYDVPDYGDWKD